MKRILALGLLAAAAPAGAQPFEVRSADGTPIHGQVDRPQSAPIGAVLLVAGTGPFERDMRLGQSNTPRDLVFKDLAERMNRLGLATVRYDFRGIRHGAPPAEAHVPTLLAGRTEETMRDDLAAVYRHARAAPGAAGRCVILFAHSEGMNHVGRMASSGAPAPILVIGMGAPMTSPRAAVHWQMAERDAHSLRLMDADRDGQTSLEEVRANIGKTPSAVFGRIEPYVALGRAWTEADLAELRRNQQAMYDQQRTETLAHADTDPWPNAASPFASYRWWKSWFTDDVAVASRIAAWRVSVRLHYGDRDSQVEAELQRTAATASLPAGTLSVQVHPDRGHTLGDHPLMGPIDEAIADRIAQEAADAARACRQG